MAPKPGVNADTRPKADDTAPRSTCAPPVSRSTLPGVRLEIVDPPCTLSRQAAAAGVSLQWALVVDAPPGEVLMDPFFARCRTPDASALAVQASVSGASGRYCECDMGNCIPSERRGVPLQGRYPGSLRWDGTTWEGPSDFSNPKGPPLAAGPLVFRVETRGTLDGRPFVVSAEAPIELLP